MPLGRLPFVKKVDRCSNVPNAQGCSVLGLDRRRNFAWSAFFIPIFQKKSSKFLSRSEATTALFEKVRNTRLAHLDNSSMKQRNDINPHYSRSGSRSRSLASRMRYSNRLMYRYRFTIEGARTLTGREKGALLRGAHRAMGRGDFCYIHESLWGSTVFYFETKAEADAARIAAAEELAISDDGYVPCTTMLQAAEAAQDALAAADASTLNNNERTEPDDK